ncbi:MAG: phosphatidate cytidylyltransferase [Methanomicrobiales archaeon]|nr:phosphatidate cytidylyltransferase [Methanomicrobiales archaeon]
MDEVARKVVHLVFGLGIAVLILFLPRDIVLGIIAVAVLSGCILSDALSRGFYVPLVSELVDRLERRNVVPGKGALYFATSALVSLIFFPTPVVVPAIVTLAVLDSIATLAGLHFGKRRVWGKKTLEGSVSGTVAAFAALILVLPLYHAVVVAMAAGILELFTPVDDNLIIPIGICILLTLVPV